MSGERRRRRRRDGPLLIEENIVTNSRSTTTTTVRTEEQKRTENVTRQWYHTDDEDESLLDELQPAVPPSNAKISKKIERVLRKINAWTNEVSSTPAHQPNDTQQNPLQDTSFNKTTSPARDNPTQGRRHDSSFIKPISTSSSLFHSFRQRCCSSTYRDPRAISSTQQIPAHRPQSVMTFADQSLPQTTNVSCLVNNANRNYPSEGQTRKVRGRTLQIQFPMLSQPRIQRGGSDRGTSPFCALLSRWVPAVEREQRQCKHPPLIHDPWLDLIRQAFVTAALLTQVV